MKCHYEVLEVSRDASDSEIKTAYRKLALKWHPDKNLDNEENAKEQFQIVQQAYEVLSDRQERAWYDNHREQILRGANSEFEDKSLDVFQYFTSSCFKGYGDDDNGFFTIYRNVFENIAKEDMEFIDEKEEFCNIPTFGDSKTDFAKVSQFYTFWLNYSTKKSYVWLDPYDINGSRYRKFVKQNEKKNKKVRQEAKKERNEEVRSLAAFVRKRDKRVQWQKKIQEQKVLEDKKKREQVIKQKRLERQQQLNESGSQPDWAKFDNVKTELEEIEKHLAAQFGEQCSDSESSHSDNFYCVACNKIFKTPKAFENHELSKKHRDNVEFIKRVMHEDEANLDKISNRSENEDNGSEMNVEDLKALQEEEEKEFVQSDSPDEAVEHKHKRKNKKSRNIITVSSENSTDYSCNEEENVGKDYNQESDQDFFSGSSKKIRRKSKKNTNKTQIETNRNGENEEEDLESQEYPLSQKGLTKKNRRDKKNKTDKTASIDIDTDHNCITCKLNFPSKNKLFDHLKKVGHGVYIPPNTKNKKVIARESRN